MLVLRFSLQTLAMSVIVTLFLFRKPGEELSEGEEVTPAELRALGRNLQDRLEQTATIVEKLTGAGWEGQMELYSIAFSHPSINTLAKAKAAARSRHRPCARVAR